MATWVEARTAKAERILRERRYYTPDRRGPRCPICKNYTDPAVAERAGYPTHPMCEPEAIRLAKRADKRWPHADLRAILPAPTEETP